MLFICMLFAVIFWPKLITSLGEILNVGCRNRFQGTSFKVPEPVPKPCTRNRFVSLTHCIICVLYASLFVNNESRNIGLKLMCLSFHFFIHLFVAFISRCLQNNHFYGVPKPHYTYNCYNENISIVVTV